MSAFANESGMIEGTARSFFDHSSMPQKCRILELDVESHLQCERDQRQLLVGPIGPQIPTGLSAVA